MTQQRRPGWQPRFTVRPCSSAQRLQIHAPRWSDPSCMRVRGSAGAAPAAPHLGPELGLAGGAQRRGRAREGWAPEGRAPEGRARRAAAPAAARRPGAARPAAARRPGAARRCPRPSAARPRASAPAGGRRRRPGWSGVPARRGRLRASPTVLGVQASSVEAPSGFAVPLRVRASAGHPTVA